MAICVSVCVDTVVGFYFRVCLNPKSRSTVSAEARCTLIFFLEFYYFLIGIWQALISSKIASKLIRLLKTNTSNYGNFRNFNFGELCLRMSYRNQIYIFSSSFFLFENILVIIIFTFFTPKTDLPLRNKKKWNSLTKLPTNLGLHLTLNKKSHLLKIALQFCKTTF